MFSTMASWKSWSGYAFEGICMKHNPLIKKALGIENVHTETSVWRSKSENAEQVAQIDLTAYPFRSIKKLYRFLFHVLN